jgi:hypothetical protein
MTFANVRSVGFRNAERSGYRWNGDSRQTRPNPLAIDFVCEPILTIEARPAK